MPDPRTDPAASHAHGGRARHRPRRGRLLADGLDRTLDPLIPRA
ncbi:hypothetical protein AB0F18_38935 [Streptomyces sp. NPDC029216]